MKSPVFDPNDYEYRQREAETADPFCDEDDYDTDLDDLDDLDDSWDFDPDDESWDEDDEEDGWPDDEEEGFDDESE